MQNARSRTSTSRSKHGAELPQSHRNHLRLVRDGEKGGGGMEGEERDYIQVALHCHHLNDSCIKMAGGESHFNVSLIVRAKVTRQCPQITTFEEKGEPKWIRTEVPLLTSLTP